MERLFPLRLISGAAAWAGRAASMRIAMTNIRIIFGQVFLIIIAGDHLLDKGGSLIEQY